MCVWKRGGVENEQVAATLLFAYVFVWDAGVLWVAFSAAHANIRLVFSTFIYILMGKLQMHSYATPRVTACVCDHHQRRGEGKSRN